MIARNAATGRLTYANAAAHRLLLPDGTGTSLVGLHTLELWPEREIDLELDRRCRYEPVTQVDLVPGTAAWVRVTRRPLDGGAVLIVAEDVTAAVRYAASRLLSGAAQGCPRPPRSAGLAALLLAQFGLTGICAALEVPPDRVLGDLARIAGVG